MDLYFEAFMGTLELFTVTWNGEILTLNTYLDTPENRAALVSIYEATYVKGWSIATN